MTFQFNNLPMRKEVMQVFTSKLQKHLPWRASQCTPHVSLHVKRLLMVKGISYLFHLFIRYFSVYPARSREQLCVQVLVGPSLPLRGHGKSLGRWREKNHHKVSAKPFGSVPHEVFHKIRFLSKVTRLNFNIVTLLQLHAGVCQLSILNISQNSQNYVNSIESHLL